MKKRTLFIAFIALAFLIAFTTAIKDHSGKFHTAGAPIPGETTCSATACHGAGNGSFTLGHCFGCCRLRDDCLPSSIPQNAFNVSFYFLQDNSRDEFVGVDEDGMIFVIIIA